CPRGRQTARSDRAPVHDGVAAMAKMWRMRRRGWRADDVASRVRLDASIERLREFLSAASSVGFPLARIALSGMGRRCEFISENRGASASSL
ncbi:MAG: hypothetical protein ACXW3J_05955, partial [Methylocystis sp.]